MAGQNQSTTLTTPLLEGAGEYPRPQDGGTTPRVLLVDDDEDYVQFVSRLFRRIGHPQAPTVVHDEAAALAALASGSFDIVVSDFELQPGNGLRVLERVRAVHPDAVRILLTSAPDNAKTHLGKDRSVANAVWDKHWSASALQDQLRRLVTRTTKSSGA